MQKVTELKYGNKDRRDRLTKRKGVSYLGQLLNNTVVMLPFIDIILLLNNKRVLT